MLITGTNPTAIVHEMGHAFHEYVQYRYGSDDLKATWSGLSMPYRFSGRNAENPDPTIFATLYASSSYYEDFAETFAQAFTANRPGLGISEYLTGPDGKRTKLGSKMRWMERFVTDYIENHEAAVGTMQLIYSTPRKLEYNGLSLSGNSLQYIGFSEPNAVYAAVIKHLGVTAEASKWISEIGGWYIKSTEGDEYYAFPGGTFAELEKAG
jgi:hypothetical protein